MRLPSYTWLTDNEWQERIDRCDTIASSCGLCPRNCGADRFSGEKGFCRAPDHPVISSIFPHHGEEPPISGTGGSGTVFFSYCTLRCCFCQNYQLSHLAEGESFTPELLAERMLILQEKGCHNINFVTATHFLPWVLRALRIAVQAGLSLPVVYNCGGFESVATLQVLNGIVDIYLPDMKYGDDLCAATYSGAAEYRTHNRVAIREMFRQVGVLRCDDNGIARRGLCIRHLVLPDGKAGSGEVFRWLSSVFDPEDVHISLMAQYRPLYNADTHQEINRMVTADEYNEVKNLVVRAGFPGFFQDVASLDKKFVIDFSKRKEQALTGDDE